MSESNNNWEQQTLKELAMAGLKEQRSSRRWGIFFKFLGFGYLFVLLLVLSSDNLSDQEGLHQKHTALIHISGGIVPGEPAAAENIIKSLNEAFENQKAAGIILQINSPGGTPVQANMIYEEIKRLRKLHADKPIYAAITDLCASGGYYVAAAAEQIYADRSSIVGSIGVRMSNFGFTGAMQKLGVERRQLTAGENKAMMDPLSPRNTSAEEHLKTMLAGTHELFIKAVKEGRGDRLKQDPNLFSGLIWNGEQSLELGLIDDFGSPDFIAREVFNTKNIVDYTYQPDFLDRFTRSVGKTMMNLLTTQEMQSWL
jgi:protease-4